MKCALWILSVLGVPICGAASRDGTYRVRSGISTNRETQVVFSDPNDLVFTNSDSGESKELDSFFLSIFETDGSMISEEFKTIVRGAMNKFLLTELNAFYEPQNNDIIAVSSEINAISDVYENLDDLDDNSNCKGGSGSSGSTCILGSLIDMQVIVSFDNEPSPSLWKLEEKTLEILQDLRHFVSNFTALGAGLPETDTSRTDGPVVTHAKLETKKDVAPPVLPAEEPAVPVNEATTTFVQTTKSSQGDSGTIFLTTVTPVLASATIIAAMVFLVLRRRKRPAPESPKQRDMVYMDVEGDLYSMDRSLESSQSPAHILESPLEERLPLSPKERNPLSSTAGDSVFSGLADSPLGNPKTVRTQSLMSGYTNASASTIRVSNIDEKSKSKSLLARGNNALFAFTEEGDEKYHDDTDEDEIEYVRGDVPFMTKSDVSEDSDVENGKSASIQVASIEKQSGTERRKSLQNDRKNDAEDPMTFSIDAKRNSTPNKGGSLNPFNWVYAKKDAKQLTEKPENKLDEEPTTPASPSDRAQASGGKAEGIALGDDTPNSKSVYTPGVGSTMETPLQRNILSDSRAESPEQVQLEWDKDVETPRSVGRMSAAARSVLGSVFGSVGTPGSRSRGNKSMGTPGSLSRGSKPGTPGSPKSAVGTLVSPRSPSRSDTPSRSKTTTPSRDPSPDSPNDNRLGRHWLRGGLPEMPPTGEDYVDSLSRPSSPGTASAEPSLQVSDYVPETYGRAPFDRVVDRAPLAGEDDAEADGGRRHAGNKMGGDGTAMYQANAMQPLDWSYKSADINSVGESTITESEGGALPSRFIFSKKDERERNEPFSSSKKGGEATTPMSEGTKGTNGSSHSASRQLINDLVWLEKKIADVRNTSASAIVPSGAPVIEHADSLSYISNDDACISTTSNDDSNAEEPSVYTNRNDSVMSSIVCRDCYAPPGKLHIVIHSTKDGPAVHTVKEGSSLEGHIFPGDLIISVDNVDTRSFTAEQVMKMMAAKSDRERKITVLHFEEED